MASQCSQRDSLKQQYLRAVNAFGEALSEAKSLRCENQRAARNLTQSTSQACQSALKAFTDHVEKHGCNADENASAGR